MVTPLFFADVEEVMRDFEHPDVEAWRMIDEMEGRRHKRRAVIIASHR